MHTTAWEQSQGSSLSPAPLSSGLINSEHSQRVRLPEWPQPWPSAEPWLPSFYPNVTCSGLGVRPAAAVRALSPQKGSKRSWIRLSDCFLLK